MWGKLYTQRGPGESLAASVRRMRLLRIALGVALLLLAWRVAVVSSTCLRIGPVRAGGHSAPQSDPEPVSTSTRREVLGITAEDHSAWPPIPAPLIARTPHEQPAAKPETRREKRPTINLRRLSMLTNDGFLERLRRRVQDSLETATEEFLRGFVLEAGAGVQHLASLCKRRARASRGIETLPSHAIVLRNPTTTGGGVSFLVGDVAYTLSPGRTHTLETGELHVVRFDRGGAFGTATHVLSEGTYEFRVTESGWELVRVDLKALRQ